MHTLKQITKTAHIRVGTRQSFSRLRTVCLIMETLGSQARLCYGSFLNSQAKALPRQVINSKLKEETT
ncbi:hypothetical protein Bca101_021368 [Brassica carinata]